MHNSFIKVSDCMKWTEVRLIVSNYTLRALERDEMNSFSGACSKTVCSAIYYNDYEYLCGYQSEEHRRKK